MSIITLTKHTPKLDRPGQGGDSRTDPVVQELSMMIGEWERTDELPSDLAIRIVNYFKSGLARASVN